VISNNIAYDQVKVRKCDYDPERGSENCNPLLPYLYDGPDRRDNAEFPYSITGLPNGRQFIINARVERDGKILQYSNHDIDCPLAPRVGAQRDCLVTVPATQGFTITIPPEAPSVPLFNTDLNNDKMINSLDWDVLLFGWQKGKYNATDASAFLWNWASQ
jgi:hypothetical protein